MRPPLTLIVPRIPRVGLMSCPGRIAVAGSSSPRRSSDSSSAYASVNCLLRSTNTGRQVAVFAPSRSVISMSRRPLLRTLNSPVPPVKELSGSAKTGRSTTAVCRARSVTVLRWPRFRRTFVGFGENTFPTVTTVGNSAKAPFGTVIR